MSPSSSVSSAVLAAQSISKSFALRTVLDRVSVTVGTEFSGTVILVSHDRRLIEAFASTHRIEL